MVEYTVPSDLAEVDVDADVLVVVSKVAEDVEEVMSVEVSVNEYRATRINQICFSNLNFKVKSGHLQKYLPLSSPARLHALYNHANSQILFHSQQDRCMANGPLDNALEHCLD